MVSHRTLHRKLARDLWHTRGQAVAIAFVIAAGVATVVLAAGTRYSLEETRTAFYERQRFADVFATSRRAPLWIERRVEEISGVRRAEARIAEEVLLDLKDVDEPARGRLLSIPDVGASGLNEIAIVGGRRPRAEHPDEVVVNEAFADANRFTPGDTLDVNMNQKRRRLKIVGIALSPEFVYAIGPGQLFPDDRRFGVLWMNRSALEAAYDLKGAFNDLSIALDHGASERDVIDRVDDLLEPYGGVGAFGRDDHVSDSFLRSEFDQLTALSTIIPPIFLAVGAFLLNIVVQRLIATQREQIGLLKAFGYSDLTVGGHFLSYVLAIAALGIAIGWGLGGWLGRELTDMYGAYYRFPFLVYILDLKLFAVAALVSGAAAVLGALVAVRRAVRIAPAVAMAPPPPTRYHAGAIERLRLFASLRPPDRMIVRHLSRWPVRSSLTCLGVAFSVALLVSSFFFLDSLEEMLDAFFFRSQRHDVAVHFVDEQSDDVKHDLRRLPGVLRAEGYRAVAARLRHGPRRELVGVTGVEPEARLTQLVDVEGRRARLPATGLVLTRRLADRLEVARGDVVRMEVLDDRRPELDVSVERIVDEYIGMGAYMNRLALSRLLREAPTASGAHLTIDTHARNELYRRLKETPKVLGVTVRRTALDTFREILGQTMGAMVGVYIAFASIIAIGVVYNNARISLAERARELGSLRVLGFHRSEVTYILLGELAVLTALALPLGCVLGYGLAALMVQMFDTDLFRLPLVITPASYGYAMAIVAAAALVAGANVARRIAHMDLVQVLKTRE